MVEDGEPLAGVLECPAKTESYLGEPGVAAFLNGGAAGGRSRGASRSRLAGPKPLIEATPRATGSGACQRAPYIPSLAYRLAMVADGDARRDLRQAECP